MAVKPTVSGRRLEQLFFFVFVPVSFFSVFAFFFLLFSPSRFDLDLDPLQARQYEAAVVSCHSLPLVLTGLREKCWKPTKSIQIAVSHPDPNFYKSCCQKGQREESMDQTDEETKKIHLCVKHCITPGGKLHPMVQPGK